MSVRTVSFHPEARQDLREAAAHYELESEALRERFLGAVAIGLDSVAKFPAAARVVRGNVRRKPLPTFPYALLYTIRDREIRILAVAHRRRRPFYWAGRR